MAVAGVVGDYPRYGSPMTHRSNHVLAHTEPGDGIGTGEYLPVVFFVFGIPHRVESLLQPSVTNGKGLMA